jgi:hypothetical protein
MAQAFIPAFTTPCHRGFAVVLQVVEEARKVMLGFEVGMFFGGLGRLGSNVKALYFWCKAFEPPK